MLTKDAKLKVYYDDLCVVCSKEINHYKKCHGSENIEFIDITSKNFNADIEGVDPFLVHKYMHVKTESGEIIQGVQSFIEIWKRIPKYNWAAQLASNAASKSILNLGYHFFVKIRPYLPRKKSEDCSASPYCELKVKS